MASSLSRTEGLRLKADYTGTEIEASVAKEVVAHAETFVRTVEKVFGLETLSKQAAVENDSSQQLDSVSQAAASRATDQPGQDFIKGPSLEEKRRQAAENWRREYYDKRSEGLGAESPQEGAPEPERTLDERDAGLDFDPER